MYFLPPNINMMADSTDFSNLGFVPHIEVSKTPVSRPPSTGDAFLSSTEIALLSNCDCQASEQYTVLERKQLLKAVSRQFNTFQSSAAQVTHARLLPAQDSLLSYSLLDTLRFQNFSISNLHRRHSASNMPYNNTAIPPPEEVTGSAALPCKHSSCEIWTSKFTSLLSPHSGESETHFAVR